MNQNRNLLQEALVAIERLQGQLAEQKSRESEPIAIVGMSCRFAGIDSPEKLWEVVRDRKDMVADVPAGRWDDSLYDPDGPRPGKMISRRGGFLDRLDQFDPQFFNISSREAVSLDPQQRLLLETAHEALENAGIAVDNLAGSQTGVFVGISTTDYAQLTLAGGLEDVDIYAANGGALNTAPGRISFVFGFEGPAMAVDTACSSSLVALHLAMRSLRKGETDLALVSGVNAVLQPTGMVIFSQMGMMAPDGKCKTFDDAADGFVRAEGCGCLVLKRLSDAVADKDPILALVRGSAANSDGRSSGLTAPRGPAQEAVIRSALADSGLKPADIDYIEAHGTGTSLGDPIEIEAIGAVMRDGRGPGEKVIVGAMKPNVGHSEAASGIGALIKVIMSFRNDAIAPNINFNTPSTRIPWDTLPVRVADDLIAWPHRAGRPRRAGISGFGMSGTNAHVILEEPPQPKPRPAETRSAQPIVVPLSARTEPALKALAKVQAEFLAANPGQRFDDYVATLATGRSHMQRRAAFTAASPQELAEALAGYAANKPLAGTSEGLVRRGESPRVGFLFTGQGAQYPGMGRGLYESEPVFRDAIDRCAKILDGKLESDLKSLMFATDGSGGNLSHTANTQPALFAIEYALAQLWQSWGVRPSIVAGHSVGEFVAATVAGVLSLEDGLTLIAERGRLMQALPAGGAMAAIFTTEQTVATRIAGMLDKVAIAAINGPEETVISGDAQAVAGIVEAFKAEGVDARALEVSHAFHSPLLEPMLDALEAAAAKVKMSPARIPLVSNLTGDVFPAGTGPDAAYWRRHARGAVRFADTVETLRRNRVGILLEIGPHPVLLGLAARALPQEGWARLPSLRRGRDDRGELLAALREFYVHGAPIDWNAIEQLKDGRHTAIPTYVFQRERFWVQPPKPRRRRPEGQHPLLGVRQLSPSRTPQFLAEIDISDQPWIGDHTILDIVLMPGAAFVDTAVAALRASTGKGAGAGGVRLSGFSIGAPLRFEADETVRLHTEVEMAGGQPAAVVLRSVSGEDDPVWTEHARATVVAGDSESSNKTISVAEAREVCGTEMDVDALYAALRKNGISFGPAMCTVRKILHNDDYSYGLIEGPASATRHAVHPAMLDGLFHLLSALTLQRASGDEENSVYVPLGIETIEFFGAADTQLMGVTTLLEANPEAGFIRADMRLETVDGRLVALISGFHAQRVTREAMERAIGVGGMADHRLAMHLLPLGDTETRDRRYLIMGEGEHAVALAQALGGEVITREGLAATLADAEGETMVVDVSAGTDRAVPMGDAVRASYMRTLDIAKGIVAASPNAGYCLLTRGAAAAAPGETGMPDQLAAIGLTRAMAAERPERAMLRLDLDPSMPFDARTAALAIGRMSQSEPEVIVRSGALLTPRLHDQAGEKLGEDERLYFTARTRGDLDGIAIERLPRVAPGEAEVEIAVRAAGLNFRDVLSVIGMKASQAPTIGSESAGVVTRVGKGVKGLKPGDRVVAIGSEAFASHVTVGAKFVVPLPDSVDFAGAVTLPNTYLTAWLSFAELENLGPGKTVLIHAAAGGVGTAAVRLATLLGATVIGTAGNPDKRAFALAQGASHVFDSRSSSFRDDVLCVTGGKGVDLVLNSLTGELIEAGMATLKPGGVFVEIGKNEIWSPEKVAEKAPNIRYRVIDLGTELLRDMARVRASFEDLLSKVASGSLKPLPVHAFPLGEAKAAFRFMANARHIGKVVLIPPAQPGDAAVRSDGTYMVTGGLGGLGMAAARWLASRGAGAIVLIGRSAPTAEQLGKIETLRGEGHRVETFAGDVADLDALARLRAETLADLPPLRGVLHAAGALSDAPLDGQDAGRFEIAARAKVDGAWALSAFVDVDPIDFFVLFSSTSSVFGSAGQANYAAANAFLNGLAAWRRAHGRPGTAIAWGAWGEAGMAANLGEAATARWERLGIGLLAPDTAFALLEQALAAEAAVPVILRMNRRRFESNASPALRTLLGAAPVEADKAEEAETDVLAVLREAPENERPAVLQRFVLEEVARVLGFNAATLDVETPLSALGFDSLMAVIVHNTMVSRLGVDIPLKNLLSSPTISELSAGIFGHLDLSAGAPASAAEPAWEEGTL